MDTGHTAIQRLVPNSSLRETVERSLSAAIISGEFPPHYLISVPSLAERFGVSATPVREAMLNLEKLGFVVPVKNKGFRVTDVSRQDLHDIVQIRTWLEAPAMQIVSEKLPAEPIGRYRELADKIVSTAENLDMQEHLAADNEFHLALLELTGNSRLVDTVAELRRQTRRHVMSPSEGNERLLKIAQSHHELLDMLVAGDGDAAEKFMVGHTGYVEFG